MENTPYLIQRIEKSTHTNPVPAGLKATFLERAQKGRDVVKLPQDFVGFINGLIPLDYMGSAEFEFGSFSKSMDQVALNCKDFVLQEFSVSGKIKDEDYSKCFKVEEQTVKVWLLALKEDVIEVQKVFTALSVEKYPKFRLKERSGIHEGLFGEVNVSFWDRNNKKLKNTIVSWRESRVVGWWDIDNHWFISKDFSQIFRVAQILGVDTSNYTVIEESPPSGEMGVVHDSFFETACDEHKTLAS